MLDSILTLATSKRFLVAVSVAIVDACILFGLDVPPETAERLTTLLTSLGGVLVLGISVSDHGKAMGQPSDVDHKGRS